MTWCSEASPITNPLLGTPLPPLLPLLPELLPRSTSGVNPPGHASVALAPAAPACAPSHPALPSPVKVMTPASSAMLVTGAQAQAGTAAARVNAAWTGSRRLGERDARYTAASAAAVTAAANCDNRSASGSRVNLCSLRGV